MFTKDAMKIFVLIPAYDERGNIKTLVDRLEEKFRKLKLEYKIFFVIQGNDGSNKLLDRLKKANAKVDYVYYNKPLGVGNAYKIGYKHIDKSATHVLTMDADLNHDVNEVPKLLQGLKESKCDLVIGSRFVEGGKFNDLRIWKRIVSRLTNKIVSGFSGIKIRDISSGFRLMKKEVVQKVSPELKINGYPSYMEFIFYSYRGGFKIKEVPITYHPRIWGESKISSVKTLVDYIRFLFFHVILNSFHRVMTRFQDPHGMPK